MNQVEITQQLKAAVALHNQGEFDQAEAIYRQVLAEDPDNFYALNFFGCIQGKRGRFDEGIRLLNRAVALQPGNPDVVYNLGNVFKDAERWDEAIFCYQQTLGLSSDCLEALNNLGVCLKEVERYEDSAIVLQRALSIDSGFAGAWLNLGNTFKEQGNYPEAIASFWKAVEKIPDFPDAYLSLGGVLKEQGEIEDAIEFYRKAIRLKPDFADAYLALGLVFKELGKPSEAIAKCQKAIELRPGFLDAYFVLGTAFKEVGRLEEAITSYQKVIEVNPDSVDAYFALGFVLKEVGRVEEAVTSFRKCWVLESSKEEVVENLVLALLALERYGEAKEVVSCYKSPLQKGSFLHYLRFLADRSEVSYLEAVGLVDSDCLRGFKYRLLRMLRSWICVGPWLEPMYDSLYSEMYEVFGIQGIDTTDCIYTHKALHSWILPDCMSLSFGIYASRFAIGIDSLQLLGPFSSDINHLSHAGHFYLMLGSRFEEKVDMAGRRVEIMLDYGIDALPSRNLCLGFSARVCDDWKRDERSHSYVELIEESDGFFVADISSESLQELGLNEGHFTAEKYKLWDPIATARNASGMFLFLRSPDYPMNPKGSVTIHSFNVI